MPKKLTKTLNNLGLKNEFFYKKALGMEHLPEDEVVEEHVDDEGFQDTAKDSYPKDHKVLAIVDPSFNFFLFFLIIDTDQFLFQGLGLYRRPARYSIQNHKDIGNKITNP